MMNCKTVNGELMAVTVSPSHAITPFASLQRDDTIPAHESSQTLTEIIRHCYGAYWPGQNHRSHSCHYCE